MKLTIAAIGRAGRGPERDLYEHYAGRIRWPLALRELEEKRKLPPPQLMQREGELLLQAAPAGATLVALDRRGKVLDSAADQRHLTFEPCERFSGRIDLWLGLSGLLDLGWFRLGLSFRLCLFLQVQRHFFGIVIGIVHFISP